LIGLGESVFALGRMHASRVMGQFPRADHQASWAGLSSCNHASAAKRRSGGTTKGNRWRRQVLVQAVWAASRGEGLWDAFWAQPPRRVA